MTQRPDDHRRKWDRAEYQRLAQDRLRDQAQGDEEGNFLIKKNPNKKNNFFSIYFRAHIQRTS